MERLAKLLARLVEDPTLKELGMGCEIYLNGSKAGRFFHNDLRELIYDIEWEIRDKLKVKATAKDLAYPTVLGPEYKLVTGTSRYKPEQVPVFITPVGKIIID